jgi:RNA polymerase sigma factor (sigma-70 family)
MMNIAQLYREHGHVVFRRARRLLRNEADALDVAQDVFLALFREPEKLDAKSSVATYLYAAATHACLNRLRDGKTRTRLVAIEAAAAGGLAPRAARAGRSRARSSTACPTRMPRSRSTSTATSSPTTRSPRCSAARAAPSATSRPGCAGESWSEWHDLDPRQ